MTNCPKCNTSLNEGQKFCNKCGAKIDVQSVRNLPPELIASIDIHEKKIARDPLNAHLYIVLGDLYNDHRYYEEALIQYQKAVSIDSSNADGHLKSGNAYARMGKFDRSIDAFDKALKLMPSTAVAEQGLLIALMELKQFPRAEALAREIVTKDPGNLSAQKALRVIYLVQGGDTAIEQVKTIITLEPHEKENYKLLGKLYNEKGDKENALIQYRKVLDIDSKDNDALYNAGLICYDKKEYVQSQQYFEKLMDAPETSTLAYLILTYIETGDIDKASGVFTKLDRVSTAGMSDEEKRLASRAYLLTAQKLMGKNSREAAKLLDRSLQIMKSDEAAKARAAIYAQEGEAAFQQKSYQEAENLYKKAHALVPDYSRRIEEIKTVLSAKTKKTILSIAIPACAIILIIIGFFTWRHFTSGVLTITYQSFEVEKIEVDGKEYKEGQLTLPSGEHTIVAKGWPSYKGSTQKIVLKGGEKKEVMISLEMEKQEQAGSNDQQEIRSAGEYSGTLISSPAPCQREPGDRTYCSKITLKLESGETRSSSFHLSTTIFRDGKSLYSGPDNSKSEADKSTDLFKLENQILTPGARVKIIISCGDPGCVIDSIILTERAPQQSRNEGKPSAQVPGAGNDLIQDAIKASFDGNSDKVESIARTISGNEKIKRGNRKVARKLNEEGLKYFSSNSYSNAVAKFKDAHQADPSDQEILNNLGFALLENGQLGEAEKVLFATIMIEPTRANAWFNLGMLYVRYNNTQSAVGSFLNGYRYSKNKDKTIDLLKQLSKDNKNNERAAVDETLRRISR